MKVAVVGATGMVGQVMLTVLAERNFPITDLILVASERSVGKKLSYKQQEYTITSMKDAIAAQPDIAIFSVAVLCKISCTCTYCVYLSYILCRSHKCRHRTKRISLKIHI